MWALIDGKRVCQIEEEQFPVVATLIWVECGPEVTTEYTYIDGQFVAPVVEPVSIKTLLEIINREVNTYIYSKYDSGTQSSFAALYVGPDSTEEIRAVIESVWEWIKLVLVYYYQAKNNIIDEKPYEYDLTQFDKYDPKVELGSIVASVSIKEINSFKE